MSTFSRRIFTRRSAGLIPSLVIVLALVFALVASPASAVTSGRVSVIVQRSPASGVAADALVRQVGGEIGYQLSIINAFVAVVDRSQLRMLQSSPAVAHVSEDAPVHMTGLLGDTLGTVDGVVDQLTDQSGTSENGGTGDASEDESSTSPVAAGPAETSKVDGNVGVQHRASPVDATTGATSVYQDVIGATDAHERRVRGNGVTVALIDTGVSNIPDLDGRIVRVKTPRGDDKACVDLSGEDSCADSYGHGTFIAGLIAGTGESSDGKYAGVAPDAKILSVKISGRDGSASVGKIIYAIQWVTQYGPQYGVKVMNLSLGTDSKQSYKIDPLNYAVERAWQSGITVVVAAGNNGAGAATVSKPADDPLVITTGASDDAHTVTVSDDVVPTFSSRGPTASNGIAKPDLVTPGTLLVSTRAPGSAVEQNYPGGGVDATYRRGSGTSQSAGVLSGSVALLLSAHRDMTPNQVKYALTHSTQSIPGQTDPNVVGSGLLNIGAAVADPPKGEANQGVVRSLGTGSLADSQGTIHLAVKDGSRVLGLLDHVLPVTGGDDADPTGLGWYGTGWYGGGWYGGGWYGGGWYGGGWYGGGWYGGGWYGGGWYGGGWYGSGWYGVWD